jgi:hypothetical protein
VETTVDCAVFLTPVADDDEASVLERERERVCGWERVSTVIFGWNDVVGDD